MGILGKYYRWKNQIEYKASDRELIEFFKTGPTQVQLEILDRYIRKIGGLAIILAVVFLGFGIALGFSIGFPIGGII